MVHIARFVFLDFFFLFAKVQQLLNGVAIVCGGGRLLGGIGTALHHGRQHRIFPLGKGIIQPIGAGHHDRDADFCFQFGGDSFQIHLDDFGGASANPNNHRRVAIALDIFTESLQFCVVIQLSGNIPFFEFRHGIAWLGKNHHTHGILQEIATSFRANH